MEYRSLGETGLDVSVIGVGTWQFGGEWGRAFSREDVGPILDAAAECGINLIDTAECYGDHRSEALIGSWMEHQDRSRWIIATKFGHEFHGFLQRRDDFTPDAVRRQLAGSLRALRTDYVDLYQFHSGPDDAFDNDALWTMLDTFRRAGTIRHLGASLNLRTTLQSGWARERGVEVLQVQYNRLDRRAEELHFPFVKRDHLGVLARVPLASGLLSGKYHRGAAFPANDVRARTAPAVLAGRIEEVERIRRDEVPAGADMAQWAIAWCLKNPLVSAVIPGCKSAEQVRGNAAAADFRASFDGDTGRTG